MGAVITWILSEQKQEVTSETLTLFPTCSALVCVFVCLCVYRCGLCVRRKISENIWSAASIGFNQLLNSILRPRLLYRARWLSDTLMTSSADWSAHYCQSTANRPNENVCPDQQSVTMATCEVSENSDSTSRTRLWSCCGSCGGSSGDPQENQPGWKNLENAPNRSLSFEKCLHCQRSRDVFLPNGSTHSSLTLLGFKGIKFNFIVEYRNGLNPGELKWPGRPDRHPNWQTCKNVHYKLVYSHIIFRKFHIRKAH